MQLGLPSLTELVRLPWLYTQIILKYATGTLQGQDFLLNGQICQDIGGLFAYSLTVGPTIAVCPSAFAKFPPTIGNARHTPQNAKLLDELRPLSNVLVHELIHVFGGPNSMYTR